MKTITAEDIEGNPANFIRELEAGQALMIVRAGQPVAEVRPIPRPSLPLRPFGLCAGEFAVPDEFGEPLPQEVI